MDWNAWDDEALGHAVDAWLGCLRQDGLSDRRILDLARLLGQAMSEPHDGPAAEAAALARFETWWRDHAETATNTPESAPRR